MEKIQELLSTISGIEGDGDIRQEDDVCHVILEIGDKPAEISLALYQAARAFDWDLMELRVEEPGLDKVFRNLTDFDAEGDSEAVE